MKARVNKKEKCENNYKTPQIFADVIVDGKTIEFRGDLESTVKEIASRYLTGHADVYDE